MKFRIGEFCIETLPEFLKSDYEHSKQIYERRYQTHLEYMTAEQIDGRRRQGVVMLRTLQESTNGLQNKVESF